MSCTFFSEQKKNDFLQVLRKGALGKKGVSEKRWQKIKRKKFASHVPEIQLSRYYVALV